jgi:predicted regulator of Ras-like GTPase activity (Roadblock/LC7/MglB family)
MPDARSDATKAQLHALRDVKGVIGSFLVNAKGALCESDMPAALEMRDLSEVGSRVSRLVEALTADGSPDTCSVRCVEHRLTIRAFAPHGYLCVLSDEHVNWPALRMATTLSTRKLCALPLLPWSDPSQIGAPQGDAHRAEPAGLAIEPAKPPAPKATRSGLIYRGQRVS